MSDSSAKVNSQRPNKAMDAEPPTSHVLLILLIER
jgi:hypothetical protein